jgi:hypothetical protein
MIFVQVIIGLRFSVVVVRISYDFWGVADQFLIDI